MFIHDVKMDEYVIGEKRAEMTVAYMGDRMLTDLDVKFTGSWMKRIFGGVTTDRDTTWCLLDADELREIDWDRKWVTVYPFGHLRDKGWIRKQDDNRAMVDEILKERYRVKDPVFSMTIAPEVEAVNGYPCRKVTARLRLETLDVKKDAASITLVDQELWISEAVPGLATHRDFHRKLAGELGLDAARLGNLRYLAQYWHGPLDKAVAAQLDEINTGYPVKNTLSVEAVYVTPSVGGKRAARRIKWMETTLREAREVGELDAGRFQAPPDFEIRLAPAPGQ